MVLPVPEHRKAIATKEQVGKRLEVELLFTDEQIKKIYLDDTYLRYVFSKVKCRKCPLCEQCRVGKLKSKERSYSITQPSEKNRVRLEFEAGEDFRERMKIRHRIEEKNGEMKVHTVLTEPIPWVLKPCDYKRISRHL